jgi:hypothetical protein
MKKMIILPLQNIRKPLIKQIQVFICKLFNILHYFHCSVFLVVNFSDARYCV